MSDSVLFGYDHESKSDDELVRQKFSNSLKSKICYSRTDRPSKDIRRGVQAVDNDNLTVFNMSGVKLKYLHQLIPFTVRSPKYVYNGFWNQI